MRRHVFIRAIVGSRAKAGIIFCLVALFACQVASAAEHKRVMLLYSFGRDFKPWSEYAKDIRAELDRQSPWPLDIIESSLVTARFSDENPEAPFIEYLSSLFAKHPLDAIVSIGAPAADFVQRNRQRLFPTTPMVFTAIDRRRVGYSNLTRNDVVVAANINYLSAFENILQVLPDTKDVMVVLGTSPIEKFWKEAIGKQVEPLTNRIKLSWTDEWPFEELLKQASALPPHSAIFWELMIVDAAGVVHEGDVALERLHAVANAPIFSYDESFFGSAIVGGPFLLVADTSRLTAAVAIRVLGGQSPGDIKVLPVEFSAPRFDWRQMQHWGISEKNLPPGSEILFRDPTAWEQYRWQITMICALVLLQAALIFGLLFESRRRQFAEVRVRQRSAELAHINRYSIVGELTTTIAHELSQPLCAILANAAAAESIIKSPAPDLVEIGEILADIRQDDERASEVIGRLRSLLKKAPFELKNIDLNEVAREAMRFLSALAIAREADLSSLISQTPLPIKGDAIQLQQVILNLIVNAMDAMSGMRPAERMITASTACDGNFADLSVSDVGPGIPPQNLKKVFEPFFSTKPKGMGMGLSIARTIVEAHGGQLSAQNQAGGGAVFHIRLPLAALPR